MTQEVKSKGIQEPSERSSVLSPFAALKTQDIRKIQKYLRSIGNTNIKVDGIAGDATKMALLRWAKGRNPGVAEATISVAIASMISEIEIQEKDLFNTNVERENQHKLSRRSAPIIHSDIPSGGSADSTADTVGRYLDDNGCLRHKDGGYVQGFKNACK